MLQPGDGLVLQDAAELEEEFFGGRGFYGVNGNLGKGIPLQAGKMALIPCTVPWCRGIPHFSAGGIAAPIPSPEGSCFHNPDDGGDFVGSLLFFAVSAMKDKFSILPIDIVGRTGYNYTNLNSR